MSLECDPVAGPVEPLDGASGYSGALPDGETLLVETRSVVEVVFIPFGAPQVLVTFPTPFPGGLVTVTFSFGDNVNLPTGTPSIVFPTVNDFTVLLPGSVVGPIRINYTAWGW